MSDTWSGAGCWREGLVVVVAAAAVPIRRRGRPRDPAVDRAILEAAVTELAEFGMDSAQDLALDALAGVTELLEPPMLAVQLRMLVESGEQGRDEYTDRVVHAGVTEVQRVFDRAVARGEAPRGTDNSLVGSALIGTIFMETTLSPTLRPPGPERRAQIVELFAGRLPKLS